MVNRTRRLMVPLLLSYLIFACLSIIAAVIFVEQTDYLTENRELTDFLLLILIIYTMSFIILATVIITIFRSIRKISLATAAYAAGNFDVRIESKRRDEIGLLANTLDYMAAELSMRQEDQRKFISNVSHDFRSPLTSIKGYAEAMRDGTIPVEMQGKYLGIIISEAERLQGLTENLLELNKYGAKGYYVDLKVFDLNELIRRIVDTFDGRCREKGITIEMNLLEPETKVKADQERIAQVLHNLIDNALKFSHMDSKSVISTTERNGKIYTSVRDFGVGIPRDSLKKVWERFYKTDPSRGKDKRGTGLGLPIVKEIIEAHKENINVISTEGVGTEFIFSLQGA